MRIAMLLHKSVVHDSRVRREAAALAAAGHDVVVLELADVEQTSLDGFRRRSVAPPPWVKRRLPFALYRFVFFGAFVRAVLDERPDVIHAHDAAMLLPALGARRLGGARIVYDSHELATSVPYRERTWAMFVAGIERIGVPRSAAVITVSDGIAARMRSLYGLRTLPVVLRNVSSLVRTGADAGLRRRLGLAADTPLVLHQGAAAMSRGCDTLVRAMAEVDDDAHLVFLGDADDSYDVHLRALVDELGVASRVHFTPSVALSELLDHTAEADVGVTLLQDSCENHRLALPNKLFEYIAAGLPVIGADLPEVSALIAERGIGWTADPEDPVALAAVIRAALQSRGDDLLRARVRAAHTDLQWDVEKRRLTDLYEALAA